MPELMQTGRERQLAPGDVLMVAKKIMKPKFGDRPYWWRFFFVVTKHRKWFVRGLCSAPRQRETQREGD
jgi:hypothetical protein